jgi:phage terminase small subunit
VVRAVKKKEKKREERVICTGREMEFCRSYVATRNKSQAYRDAGYSCGKMTSTEIANAAGRIYNRPCVQAEIKRTLAAQEEARAEAYKEDFVVQLSQWTREDSLNALREIVEKGLEATRTPIFDENGEVVDYKFDPSAARVVRDAVESLNKMQGYNEPEKSEVDAVISVAFADGSDFTG